MRLPTKRETALASLATFGVWNLYTAWDGYKVGREIGQTVMYIQKYSGKTLPASTYELVNTAMQRSLDRHEAAMCARFLAAGKKYCGPGSETTDIPPSEARFIKLEYTLRFAGVVLGGFGSGIGAKIGYKEATVFPPLELN